MASRVNWLLTTLALCLTGTTAAIAGSRNPDHVRANAGAGDVELNDAMLAELERALALGPSFG